MHQYVLTFNNCTLCPHCIYVFCIYLRTNSDLCHLQHKLIGFYNRDEKCLQRGTDWVFKWSGLRFVFKGLKSPASCRGKLMWLPAECVGRTQKCMYVVCVGCARNCLMLRTIRVHSSLKFYENPFILPLVSTYGRWDMDIPILEGLFL